MWKALLFVFFISCSKNQDSASGNYDKVIDRFWKAYQYSQNGIPDPFVVSQQPTFNFRQDGKMYFTQINPVYKDTLQFRFINETNIKLTKPWITAAYSINLRIDLLTDYDFDFTATNTQDSDIDVYKTTKQ